MPTFIEKLRALSNPKKIAIMVVVVVIAIVGMGYFWVKSVDNGISKISQSANSIELPNMNAPGLPNLPNN